jgi:hypothetical protein
MTGPKSIFEDADYVKKDGKTIGLQSGLLTDAWTGAYLLWHTRGRI